MGRGTNLLYLLVCSGATYQNVILSTIHLIYGLSSALRMIASKYICSWVETCSIGWKKEKFLKIQVDSFNFDT